MLGIWLNSDDFRIKKYKYEDLEILMRFGFTDLFILIKGIRRDVRNIPEYLSHTDWLFREGARLGFRTHGVFICSIDWNYTEQYPEKKDVNIFGKRKRGIISHLDSNYQDYLIHAILTAVDRFPMDAVQLDHLRFRNLVTGWGPDEEAVYRSCGVCVDEMKNEIKRLYDVRKPDSNLTGLLRRFDEGDPQMEAFSAARRSILRNFTQNITQEVRRQFPEKELSIVMMPQGLDPAEYNIAMLHLGQSYQDLHPLADHLFPMAYAASFEKTTDWIGRIAKAAAKQAPGAVLGLECNVPRTGNELRADLNIIHGQTEPGISLFRYGKMIFALRDGKDTLLYNTYPGTVTRLVLKAGTTESVMNCSLYEESALRIKGHWDQIRPFGSFTDGYGIRYEGELCIVYREDLKEYSSRR